MSPVESVSSLATDWEGHKGRDWEGNSALSMAQQEIDIGSIARLNSECILAVEVKWPRGEKKKEGLVHVSLCQNTVADFIPGNARRQHGNQNGFQIKHKFKLADSCCLEILFAHSISISIWLFDSKPSGIIHLERRTYKLKFEFDRISNMEARLSSCASSWN